jgi:hypothetical protein
MAESVIAYALLTVLAVLVVGPAMWVLARMLEIMLPDGKPRKNDRRV